MIEDRGRIKVLLSGFRNVVPERLSSYQKVTRAPSLDGLVEP
jgi:hypothetical protein